MGSAEVVNTAAATGDATANAGSDRISTGSGDDIVAGDALASGSGGPATSTNDAEAGDSATANAGDDTLVAGTGDDMISGDATTNHEDGHTPTPNKTPPPQAHSHN